MKGPEVLVRSERIKDFKNIDCLFEWRDGQAYLLVDSVRFRDKKGAILCYYNPPVHQVGNPGLDAYLKGLGRVMDAAGEFSFLLLHGPCDPVHTGGDLKESLTRLDATLQLKKEKEASGAPASEIDALFDWADNRLRKGMGLHSIIRKIASHMRVVATCGGGTRFGGSAEIPLMADYLVGDSRSGMCFSEAMIGLIPGWAGVARAIVKAGRQNAEFMAKTSREVKAAQLGEMGIYSKVVNISIPFPRKKKSPDPRVDRNEYEKACADHEMDTGLAVLPEALAMCVWPPDEIGGSGTGIQKVYSDVGSVEAEVLRRMNPQSYAGLYGRPLSEVRDEISRLGRPLAPQSIAALDRLFSLYNEAAFDEEGFVETEMREDAALYRDQRFRAGLVGTLEQRVADFRGV